MRPASTIAVLAAALCLARPAAAQRWEALWYSTDSPKSTESFLAHAGQISVVAPQVFAFDRNGGIHGKLDRRVVAAAREHGVKLVPLVMNPGFDQPTIHRILNTPTVRGRAVRSYGDGGASPDSSKTSERARSRSSHPVNEIDDGAGWDGSG